MNQDEITAMAKEAGARSEHWATKLFHAVQFLFTPDDLSRFAALVAAKEREACALVCDAKAHEVRFWCNESNAIACAAAIRARGQKDGA